jgi:hypothetical protein
LIRKVMDRLTKEQNQEINRLQPKQKKPPNIYCTHEELSQQDWEEIMGMYRETYIRVIGAVRSK